MCVCLTLLVLTAPEAETLCKQQGTFQVSLSSSYCLTCASELNPEWRCAGKVAAGAAFFNTHGEQRGGNILRGVFVSGHWRLTKSHACGRGASSVLDWTCKNSARKREGKTVISEPGAWATSSLPLCDEVDGRRQFPHLRLSVFEWRNHRNSKNAKPNMAWGYIVVRKPSWVLERPRLHNNFRVPGSRHTEWGQQHPPCTTEMTVWAALHSPLFYSEVKY